MNELPLHRYVADGVKAGHDDGVLRRAAKRAASMKDLGLLPVLSLGHLAHLTGADYWTLRSIVERESDPYIDITRPKKSGGVRLLSSPMPALMGVQRWILDHVLTELPNHASSFAYQRNRSAFDCASQHIGARWLLKADLHDFFPTICERRVYRQIRSLGYGALVAFEMARLCTRLSRRVASTPARYRKIPAYSDRRIGTLPQGAPSSGALANSVATGLDEDLSRFAIDHGLVYTRYSDDLTFSASDSFNREAAQRLIPEVRNLVRGHHFMLHERKTRIVPPGSRLIVLGLVVGEQRVRLTREYRRRIETHVRGANKFGLSAHSNHRGFESLIGFVNHVDGSLAHAIGIEEEYGRSLQLQWNEALAKAGYSSIPTSALPLR